MALDVSQSWLRASDSSAWRTALTQARAVNESVLLFGDSVRAAGPAEAQPNDRASRVAAVADRASALGRAVVVLTDGEVDDPAAATTLPAGSRISVLSRPPRPDAALATLDAPRAVVAGDTITARVVIAAGGGGAPPGEVSLALGGRRLARVPFDALEAFAERSMELRAPVGATGAAPALLQAIVEARGDAESRNDTLSMPLRVAPAAGAVFVSTSPDYDARYVINVLRGALALPTRGFVRVAPGAWRVEGSLAPVQESEVRRAVRAAPLVVLHGDSAVFGPMVSATRAAYALIVPPRTGSGSADEWYATGAPPSPLSATLAALPWDSLSPLDVAATQPTGEWEGLEARRARRLDRRVVLAGAERPRRHVIVTAAGFWRWAFRGGVGADAYAALWGSIFDWLASERSDARAVIADDPLLRAGEPVRWRRGSADDSIVTVTLRRRQGGRRPDTLSLRFDAGSAEAQTPPMASGVYDVAMPGGSDVLVVNASRELVPRRPTVQSGSVGGSGEVAADRPRLRSFLWPFVALVALLCVEWLVRRRFGLR